MSRWLSNVYTKIVVYGLSAVALVLWARRVCCKTNTVNNTTAEDSSSASSTTIEHSANRDADEITTNDEKNPEEEIPIEVPANSSTQEQTVDNDETASEEKTAEEEDEQVSKKQHPLVRKYLSKRLPYLDVIKVVMAVAVVFAHCSQAAGTIGFPFWAPNIANYSNWLQYIAMPIAALGYCTLMNLFFFISGVFTPRSFKHKSTEEFIFDKLKRLMLPVLIVFTLMGPLTEYITSFATGSDYKYAQGGVNITWFLIRLCLLNLAYAFVMTTSTGEGDRIICSWFDRFLKFDTTIYFWVMAVGIVNGIVQWAGCNHPWNRAEGMNLEYLQIDMSPGNNFPLHNFFFFLGCYAGQQGWLEYFENSVAWTSGDDNSNDDMDVEEGQSEWNQKKPAEQQARNLIICSYYTLPIVYVLVTGMFVYLALVVTNSSTTDWPFIETVALNGIAPLMALAAIVVILDYACHKIKKINLLVLMMMQAAYAVYLIHPIILVPIMDLWVYILRSGFGIDVEFQPNNISDTELGGGVILLGWVFVVVLTQLLTWPFAFFVRKLPILNQMI